MEVRYSNISEASLGDRVAHMNGSPVSCTVLQSSVMNNVDLNNKQQSLITLYNIQGGGIFHFFFNGN